MLEMQQRIKSLAEKHDLPINAAILLCAAKRLGFSWKPTSLPNVFDVGGWKLCGTYIAGMNREPALNVDNKASTLKALASAGFAVPNQFIVRNLKDAEAAANEIHYPVVIKPRCGSGGHGVTVGIYTIDDLRKAFKYAREFHSDVCIEQFIPGRDFRFLVLKNEVIAVAERVPAHIIGDGISTVNQLIQQHNRTAIAEITYSADMEFMLTSQGLNLNSVVEYDQMIRVRSVANVSAGGVSFDVTDIIDDSYKRQAVEIAREMECDLAGVDILISTPAMPGKGYVIEVNARPQLRLHTFPANGPGRDVALPIMKFLLDNGGGKVQSLYMRTRIILAMSSALVLAMGCMQPVHAQESPRDKVHVTVSQYNPASHTLTPVKASVLSESAFVRVQAPQSVESAKLSYAVYRSAADAPLTRSERLRRERTDRRLLRQMGFSKQASDYHLKSIRDLRRQVAAGSLPDPGNR